MSTRQRVKVKADLAKLTKVRDARAFNFRGDAYAHTPAMHLLALSAYTQASNTGLDQELVLVDVKRKARKRTYTITQLQTLLDKLDRAAKRVEKERTNQA